MDDKELLRRSRKAVAEHAIPHWYCEQHDMTIVGERDRSICPLCQQDRIDTLEKALRDVLEAESGTTSRLAFRLASEVLSQTSSMGKAEGTDGQARI